MLNRYQESGDQKWISDLFVRYLHMIYGLCLRYCPDAMEAEDLTMEVYEKIRTKAQSHAIQSFKSWLYVVTKNHCLEHIRKLTGQRMQSFDPEFMQNRDFLHPIEEVESWQEKEVHFDMLEDCMQALNQLQKDSIRLFYYDGKTYAQIAHHLEINISQVRSFLQNGRRNLKNCVEALMK